MAQTPFFSITQPDQALWDGGYTAKEDQTLMTGYLVVDNNDGTLSAAGVSDKPAGVVVNERTMVYRPTTFMTPAGEYVTLVRGHIEAFADASFFYGGTLPNAGDKLYSYTGGLMRTSGTNQVGRCMKVESVRYQPNTTSNVARIELHISPKDE